jgi:hypothetical protein
MRNADLRKFLIGCSLQAGELGFEPRQADPESGGIQELCQVLTKCKCIQGNDLQVIMAGRRVDFRADPSMKIGSIGGANSGAIKVYVHKRVTGCSREESVFDLP